MVLEREPCEPPEDSQLPGPNGPACPGPAAPMVDAIEILYGIRPSIYDRFPGLGDTLLMQMRVFDSYASPNHTNITFKFFNAEGQRLLIPDSQNERDQLQTQLQYKRSVIQHGCVPGVRGSPWAKLSNTPDGFPFNLITFGNLTQGVYLAASEEPENANVKATLAIGLPGRGPKNI